MTSQVSVNEMMNHLGTAILVLSGSIVAYILYPNIGLLFAVSPIACVLFVFFLNKIKPGDIDHDAARGLKKEVKDEENSSYVPPGGSEGSMASSKKNLKNKPSFVFGFGEANSNPTGAP